VDLRLHAHDQVVVGEGLDVRERVDTVGAQVLRGVRRVEHARQRPHLVALPVVVRGRAQLFVTRFSRYVKAPKAKSQYWSQ
jgi:hypothetical protein